MKKLNREGIMPACRPRVSVIIPAFNASRYIGEALDSVLAQDFKDFEIIVVDDGSTHPTAEIVAGYSERGVHLHRRPNCGGRPGQPRNIAASLARGDFLAFLDADDIWRPAKLSRVVAFLDQVPDLGLVFTDSLIIDEEGNRAAGTHLSGYPRFRDTPKLKLGADTYLLSGPQAYETLFYEQYITPSRAVVPRRIFDFLGGFDETLLCAEDRDLWWRVARQHDIGYLDIVGH